MSKPPRVIGASEEAIARAEAGLGRALPATFRSWLGLHNGQGIEDVIIFPVFDDRDQRKTWDSIVRQLEQWRSYSLDVFGESNESLLPFASFGTGDFYCFDYSATGPEGEPPVVHWSHETAAVSLRALTFTEFVQRVQAGEFAHD